MQKGAHQNRWKISEVQQIPNYMKITLMALFDTINDIASTFSTQKGLDILPQLKRLDELQRGDVPKSIQCHMNETNVSEPIARDHIRYLIKSYWKLLNGEYFSNFNLEESFKRYVLNFPRTTQCIYQNGDGYGKPDHDTKDRIISLLINPIPL